MEHHSSEPRGRQADQSGTSPPETKECRRCGQTKAASEFFSRRNSPDGLQSYCKTCRNEARRTGGTVGRPRNSQNAIPASVIHFDQLPDSALLGARAVATLMNLSPRTLALAVDGGRLPAPRHDGHRRVWSVGQVRAVLAGEAA